MGMHSESHLDNNTQNTKTRQAFSKVNFSNVYWDLVTPVLALGRWVWKVIVKIKWGANHSQMEDV